MATRLTRLLRWDVPVWWGAGIAWVATGARHSHGMDWSRPSDAQRARMCRAWLPIHRHATQPAATRPMIGQ